jgi:hypothetical protein
MRWNRNSTAFFRLNPQGRDIMALKHDQVVKKIVGKGEEMIGKAANQLMANEKFMMAVQQVIARAMETKVVVDKNVQHALSSLNIPSTADMKKFMDRLGEVEELLDGVSEKLSAIDKKLDVVAPAKKTEKKE